MQDIVVNDESGSRTSWAKFASWERDTLREGCGTMRGKPVGRVFVARDSVNMTSLSIQVRVAA